MSTVVEALPTLNNTNNNNILSLTTKEELDLIKITKTNQSLRSESRENIDIATDLTCKIEGRNNVATQEKSNIELIVDPKCASASADNQHEKHDKIDEGLSNEKQQVPKSIQVASVAQGTQVRVLRMTVMSPGRADVVLPIPFPSTTSKATLFTLKEGSKYRIKFHFTVSTDTINNLKYTYMVWKSGLRVHQTKKMVGTFRPRQEAYVYELEEGTTPTGFFARGPFFVKSKFVDDEENCYLDTNYYFDIRKDWGAREKC